MFFKSIKRAFAPQQLVTTLVTSLIVAGVAAAATIGSAQIANNSVTGVDIKNNTIGTADVTNNGLTSVDIKNGSLLGVDLKANTIAGNQVNEATLAKVPSATAADTATTATSATNATNAANADKLGGKASSDFVSADTRKFFSVKLAGGATQTIATNGPVSLVAKCTLNSGGNDIVDILGATTVDGAFLAGDDDLDGGPTPATDNLNVATADASRQLLTYSNTTTVQEVNTNIDEGYVLGADGSYIGLDGESTVLGVNAFGAVCVAAGYVNLGKIA